MGSRYLSRRILQAILTIVGIVLLNFILFRAMPGSPERIVAQPEPVGGGASRPSGARGAWTSRSSRTSSLGYVSATAPG